MSDTENENKTSIIRFKDEALREKYREIIESLYYSQQLLSASAYVIAQNETYKEQDVDMPDMYKMRVDALFEEFPELKGVKEPQQVAEMFRPTIVNDMLELAVLIVTASKEGKVEFSNIHDVLMPLIFSEEGGIESNEEEIDEMIDAVEALNLDSIAEA